MIILRQIFWFDQMLTIFFINAIMLLGYLGESDIVIAGLILFIGVCVVLSVILVWAPQLIRQ